METDGFPYCWYSVSSCLDAHRRSAAKSFLDLRTALVHHQFSDPRRRGLVKIVHMSDLHLGYGSRQRARDIVRAFESAMARAAELEPDLVVVSGDVFDHSRVTAPTIAVFAKAVARFHVRRPDVPVAVAAGTRDTPLDAGVPSPLALVGKLKSVTTTWTSVRRLRIRTCNAQVVLVPHRAVTSPRPLEVSPNPSVRWNVLVVHAGTAASGAARDHGAGHGGGTPATSIPLAGWDYVALGSDHTHRKVAERAWYAGSLERVGPNPWEEASDQKGFVTFDADSGEATFCPVEARAVISLAPVDATDGGTATATRRLTEALAGVPGEIDGKLLRVPVKGLSASDLAALDQESLTPLRQRATELRVVTLPEHFPSARRGAAAASAGSQQPATDGHNGAGPAWELRDARGLVAFVGDGEPAWEECLASLRDSRAVETKLERSADGGALRPEEWAAVRHGEGPVATWLSAARALAASREDGDEEPTGRDDDAATRLRSLREEEAEVRGDLEAGMVAWVRERQDAETRLLLYRDRGRELKERLRRVEDASSEGSCLACGAPLGERLEGVRRSGREEWEGVVQDGRWWRQRLDQLEHKPAGLKALEMRALALAARVAELADEPELTVAGRRAHARIHAEFVEITGGRLAADFPSLFAEWSRGGCRCSARVSALETAARIAMAELALEAGFHPGSMIFPASLALMVDQDIPRALVRLSYLARRIPLVLVNAPERVVAAAPESFDLFCRLAAGSQGEQRIRRQRLGLGLILLEAE